MRRVDVNADEMLEEKFPAEWPARARIDLTDGRRLEKYVEHPKGDPGNPLSWAELIAKFKSLAVPIVSSARSDEIVTSVREGNSWRGILRQI